LILREKEKNLTNIREIW